jgi:hypothetical protein
MFRFESARIDRFRSNRAVGQKVLSNWTRTDCECQRNSCKCSIRPEDFCSLPVVTSPTFEPIRFDCEVMQLNLILESLTIHCLIVCCSSSFVTPSRIRFGRTSIVRITADLFPRLGAGTSAAHRITHSSAHSHFRSRNGAAIATRSHRLGSSRFDTALDQRSTGAGSRFGAATQRSPNCIFSVVNGSLGGKHKRL